MNNTIKLIGAFVGGLAAGSITTYITVKKRFAKLADTEIASVKKQYQLLRKEDGTLGIYGEHNNGMGMVVDTVKFTPQEELPEPGVMVEHAKAVDTSSKEMPEVVNIFDRVVEVDEEGNVVGPDSSDEGVPYLIDVETFSIGNDDFDKVTVHYYAGDDALLDENNKVLEDWSFVGSENIASFENGARSGDSIYVRNDLIETDFEVEFHSGLAAVEVFGLSPSMVDMDDIELSPRARRMRDEA